MECLERQESTNLQMTENEIRMENELMIKIQKSVDYFPFFYVFSNPLVCI